jgi:predicted RNase H-like HicB family nuclease
MKEYLVIYERGATSWGAYVPDLPGCVAAGGTLEEVKQLIRGAIEGHLEVMSEYGEPIPEPTTQSEHISVAA